MNSNTIALAGLIIFGALLILAFLDQTIWGPKREMRRQEREDRQNLS